MRRFLLLLSAFATLVVSCKKDDPSPSPGNPTTPASVHKFHDTINESLRPMDICEDNAGNLLFLGTDNGQVKVVKLTASGGFTWANTYSSPGEVQNIAACSNNDFLITTATSNFNSTQQSLGSAYYQDGYTPMHQVIAFPLTNSEAIIPTLSIPVIQAI